MPFLLGPSRSLSLSLSLSILLSPSLPPAYRGCSGLAASVKLHCAGGHWESGPEQWRRSGSSRECQRREARALRRRRRWRPGDKGRAEPSRQLKEHFEPRSMEMISAMGRGRERGGERERERERENGQNKQTKATFFALFFPTQTKQASERERERKRERECDFSPTVLNKHRQ